MPQARSGGSGSSSSGGSGRRTARTSRSKSSGSSSTSSRAKSTGRSTSGRSTGGRSTAKRSTAARSTSARGTRSSRSTKSTATTARRRAGAATGSAEARVEAVAQRLRKLNERIIEAGKDAGETTLASYEKALKTIASTIEKGPGSSDVEWVANLATAQAKFIRDLTTSWTSAARKVLK
jgi:hypothetical protein